MGGDRRSGYLCPLSAGYRQATDAVVNITTGAPRRVGQDRLPPPRNFKPEMCSLNHGLDNFASPRAKRIKQWKHAWEEAYVVTPTTTFSRQTTFRDIAYILASLSDAGTRSSTNATILPSLQSGAFIRPRAREAPVLRLDDLRDLGGYRPDLENLIFMRQTVTDCSGRCLSLVGTRCRGATKCRS